MVLLSLYNFHDITASHSHLAIESLYKLMTDGTNSQRKKGSKFIFFLRKGSKFINTAEPRKLGTVSQGSGSFSSHGATSPLDLEPFYKIWSSFSGGLSLFRKRVAKIASAVVLY